MKEKIRWYKNKKKMVHSRKESWFSSKEREEVYEKNFIRIKGEGDLSKYEPPKPKPKSKPKKKNKKKES